MDYYNKFINTITDSISIELNFPDEKREIIAYAVETLLLTILGFLLILGISSLLNALLPAVIAAISGGLLRRVSGGAHFDTPFKCLLFGAVIYSFIGLIVNKIILVGTNTDFVSQILMMISLFLVLCLSPVDSNAKPIHSKKLKIKLKVASVVLVSTLLLFINYNGNNLVTLSIALGITYQSITLLPFLNDKEV